MNIMTSSKPYLIRAMYEWIVDNNLTPYILVNAEHPQAEVPQAHVMNGRIVLNVSPDACRGLHIDNDKLVFSARFGGNPMQIFVTPAAILAIYAKENGRGMEFGPEYDEPTKSHATKNSASHAPKRGKPQLRLVEQDNPEQE